MHQFQKRALALTLCLLILLLSSCGIAKKNDYLAFQNRSFTAEIQGVLNEIEFTAKITSACADGGLRDLCVEFLSPTVLEGVKVECLGDSKARLTCGDLVLPATSEDLNGLLSPLTALLDLQTPSTVQKLDENLLLSFPNQTTLLLSPSLIPLSLDSPSVSYSVVWWE